MFDTEESLSFWNFHATGYVALLYPTIADQTTHVQRQRGDNEGIHLLILKVQGLPEPRQSRGLILRGLLITRLIAPSVTLILHNGITGIAP